HININDEHGIDHLGDIIESSLYSPNVQYYGALHNDAHVILGRQADPHGKFNLPPSVMEHFETATRDPAFFRLHKYITISSKSTRTHYLLTPRKNLATLMPRSLASALMENSL
ncbi:hypothetical protein GUF81_17405, partial [Xanthomonas citri pv. citri]|nr:hypothetical protein [Xanthomonas citri pv. citri]